MFVVRLISLLCCLRMCRHNQLFSLWHFHKSRKDHFVVSPTGTGKTAPLHCAALSVTNGASRGKIFACVVPLISIIEDMKKEFDTNNRVRVYGYHSDSTLEKGTNVDVVMSVLCECPC